MLEVRSSSIAELVWPECRQGSVFARYVSAVAVADGTQLRGLARKFAALKAEPDTLFECA
jgi:hypothetical protein